MIFSHSKSIYKTYSECLLDGESLRYRHRIKKAMTAQQQSNSVLVATTAIAMSRFDNVAVIGEDTDILILLLHHYDVQNVNNIYFTTEKKHERVPLVLPRAGAA